MEKIRKGNDIVILWDIFKIEDGAEVPYDLTGKSLALYLNNAVEKVKVSDFSVSENTVRMVFWGKEQKNSGIYSLTLVENEGLKGMYTVDECSAFELVPRSCLAGGSQESKVDIVTLKLRGTMMVGGGVVDDHLSDTSENAVMNRVVTEELNRKAYAEDVPQRLSQLTDDVGLVTIEDVPTKVSELENDAEYTQKEYVDSQIAYLYEGKASKADLARKQDVLRAGTGIVINGNTVYCTLDTSVFKVVSYLPETGELQKIYLVPSDIRGEKNIYKEYAYIGNKWEVIGEFTSDIDLSEYAKKEDIHTPDWNAAEGEDGHIKNRTHYADFVEVDIPEDIASSEAEVTIPHIVGAPILVHYRGYVTSKYLKIDAEDHELHVLSYGPAFKIRRGYDNTIYISGHNDENHRLYIATHFVALNEIFLPETIARKSEMAELSAEMVASQSVFTQGENNPTIWAILDMAIKNGQDNTRYVLQLKREANLQQVVVFAYAQGASSYKAYVNLVYKTLNFDIGIHTYQGMMDTGEDISIMLDWDKVKGNFTGTTYQLNNEVFNGGKSSLKIMAVQSDIAKLQERAQELDNSVKEKNNRLILGASIFSAMPSENANVLGIVDFSLKNSREGKAYMLQVNKTTSEQQVVVFCYNPSNPIYDNYVNLVYKTSNFEDGIKEYRGELTTGEKIAIIVNWELVEGKNTYRTTEYTFSDDVYNGGKSWLRIKDLEAELRSLESQLGVKEVSEIYYAACGDSITNANHATIYDIAESDPYMPIDGYPELNTYKRKNYAYYIAKANNIKWANYGFGGTTLVDAKPKAFASANLFPFSADRMRQMKEGVTWDYISVFFGWNDCYYGVTYQKDLWLKETYGTSIGYPMQESQIGAEGFATAEQKAACDAATGSVGGKQYDNTTDYFIARFIGTIDSTNNSTWLGAWNTTLYYLMRKHPKAKILIIAPYLDTQYNAVRDALELVAQKWGVALFDFKEIPDWFYQRERNYTTLPNPNRQDGKWQTAAGNLLGNHVEGYNVARYSYDSLHPSNLGYERMWRFINAKLI